MTKKPAPKKKKKPGAVVRKADKIANKNLRRVLSHALASGGRNVRRFGVVLTCDTLVDPHYIVTVEFVDKCSKGKWR